MNWPEVVPLAATLVVVVSVLGLLHYLLIARKPHLGAERLFPRQLALIGVTLVGLIIAIFALPVTGETRNQILGVLGLLLSGIFAFSSTTVVANLFAGLLLRIMRPFSTGDFVRVGDDFGRVSERGLFDTEIQSETRELIALPNAYLITHPIRATLRSGTIISARLSLGYDVHHRDAERLLLQAAKSVGLDDPFVHVEELGDFAVTYRVAGLLTDVKWLMTARSELNRAVLDTLHEARVEIASPSIMNQRPIKPDAPIIPARRRLRSRASASSGVAEDVAFDKAERAGQREEQRDTLALELAELEARLAADDGEQKESLKQQIEALKERLAALAGAANEDDTSP